MRSKSAFNITDGTKRALYDVGAELGRHRTLFTWSNPDNLDALALTLKHYGRDDLPATVHNNLLRAKQLREQGVPLKLQPTMSRNAWDEVIMRTVANSAQILNTTTETIMVPDYTILGNYLNMGAILRYTVFFNTSTVVTTPGTVTFRARWGGVAGTIMVASAAQRPKTTVSTAFTSYIQYYIIGQADPSAASAVQTVGLIHLGQSIGDAQAMQEDLIPQTAPTAVNLNTGANTALSLTAAFSVATATTQLTSNLGVLESLN